MNQRPKIGTYRIIKFHEKFSVQVFYDHMLGLRCLATWTSPLSPYRPSPNPFETFEAADKWLTEFLGEPEVLRTVEP